MLQNAYLLAKIGADTAENERNFAEYLRKFAENCAADIPGKRAGASTDPAAKRDPAAKDPAKDRLLCEAAPTTPAGGVLM